MAVCAIDYRGGKMSGFLVCLLVIIFINEKIISIESREIIFSDVNEISNYFDEIYNAGIEHVKINSMFRGSSHVRYRSMYKQLNALKLISMKFINWESRIDEKMSTAVKLMLENNNIDSDLENVRFELNSHIDDVDYLHKKSMLFKMDKSHDKKILKEYSNSILLGRKNVPRTLFNIHQLISPGVNQFIRQGFLSLMWQYISDNYEMICDKFTSPQQLLYAIYINIIITELKGFISVTQAYLMLPFIHDEYYAQEYIDIKYAYNMRLMKYSGKFIKYMGIFPNYIRRCNIKNPQRENNYYELINYSSIIVATENELTANNADHYGSCKSTCKDIKQINHKILNVSIHDCENIGSVTGCMITSYPQQQWLWLKSGSKTYGHIDDRCNYPTKTIDSFRRFFYYCEVCMCSVEHSSYLTNSKISLSPQMSDIANNMIVVGVQFVIKNTIIHLQIKQAEASTNGFIKNKSVWKPLHIDINNTKQHFDLGYFSTSYYEGHAYLKLDDIGVHPDHVVTGVRFQKGEVYGESGGYELHLHSTKYDYKSGKLLESESRWNKPGEYPIDKSDYKRPRIDIDLTDVDDPVRIKDYYPDPQSNKKIKFQHTSRIKDVGQNTVPFLDAQPVESYPGFVLGGIGLFHRYHHGFGGYIAPRLFTHNVTRELEMSMIKFKNLVTKFERA